MGAVGGERAFRKADLMLTFLLIGLISSTIGFIVWIYCLCTLSWLARKHAFDASWTSEDCSSEWSTN